MSLGSALGPYLRAEAGKQPSFQEYTKFAAGERRHSGTEVQTGRLVFPVGAEVRMDHVSERPKQQES